MFFKLQNSEDLLMEQPNVYLTAGVGLGNALAITISWSLYHSIGWAIVHGICTWFYVIYYACTRSI